MEKYWKTRLRVSTTTPTAACPSTHAVITTSFQFKYDRHRQTLITQEEEGWAAEIRHYLNDMPVDVTKETDIVEWWKVHNLYHSNLLILPMVDIQENCKLYPTLAHIALDILPYQASSVPCECLFSASKEVATDRHARLGVKRFEELQIMKFSWRPTITDLAVWNSD